MSGQGDAIGKGEPRIRKSRLTRLAIFYATLFCIPTACLLALDHFSPKLLSEIIANYDLSDTLLGSIIALLLMVIIRQEKRIRQLRSSS